MDVGWGQVVQALVVAVAVVVVDECADLMIEGAGQEVIFQGNPVLHCLMPALYFALDLWVMRRTANMIQSLVVELVGQVRGDAG